MARMSYEDHFIPTAAEYRSLLQGRTKSQTKRAVYLLDHESLGTREQPIPAELEGAHLDIIGFLPFEIVTVITGYFDPVDLISSRRVRNDDLISITDEQSIH